jgi:hypothetical protein
MQDQGAGVEPDQEVFCAPFDGPNGVTVNGGFEFGGDGPAQTPLAYDDIDDAPLQQRRRNAASCCFYFRELGRVRLGRSIT